MSAPKQRRPTRVLVPPVGVSTRTRLRVTQFEMSVLSGMVEHTTRLRNADLAAAAAGVGRAERRKAVGPMAHTRIVDTMTADTNELVALRRRNLVAERAHLRAALAVLERRIAAPTRDSCGHAPLGGRRPTRRTQCSDCRGGYPTRNERHQKTRRRQVLAARLADVERRLVERRYPLLPGGRRRAKTRLHLTEAGLTAQGWRDEWATARAWCAASGSTGENRGNRVFKLDPATGRLAVTVPLPVAATHGLTPAHAKAAGAVLTLAAPVRFALHGAELTARIAHRLGVRFDLEPSYRNGRVAKLYLRASWTREEPPPAPTLATARAAGVLGVDLNADHLAAHQLDAFGNPVGRPVTIPLAQTGPARLRDARVREAITALLGHAKAVGAGTLVVEDLDFADPTSRETTGRGRRRKTFRRTVAGIPTAALRHRLPAMAARAGITVICVDPRYTSKVGGRGWADRLARTPRSGASDAASTTPTVVATRHHGAAIAIARRGLGLRLAPRATGQPRTTRPAPHARDGSSTPTGHTGGDAGVVTRDAVGQAGTRTAQQYRPTPARHAPPPPHPVVEGQRTGTPDRKAGSMSTAPAPATPDPGPLAARRLDNRTGRTAGSPTCRPC